MSSDLILFLRARLDEDEQMTRNLLKRTPRRWRYATDVGDWLNYATVIEGNPSMDGIRGRVQFDGELPASFTGPGKPRPGETGEAA